MENSIKEEKKLQINKMEKATMGMKVFSRGALASAMIEVVALFISNECKGNKDIVDICTYILKGGFVSTILCNAVALIYVIKGLVNYGKFAKLEKMEEEKTL